MLLYLGIAIPALSLTLTKEELHQKLRKSQEEREMK